MKMEQRENQKIFLEFGRLLGINEIMKYTSLGRNTAMELGKSERRIRKGGQQDNKGFDTYPGISSHLHLACRVCEYGQTMLSER